MKLTFTNASESDVPALISLRTAVAADLARRNGNATPPSPPSERAVLFQMRHAQTILAYRGKTLAGSLRLATKKPWAIDVKYFTPVKKPIYLTDMAVTPKLQRLGLGRKLLEQAITQARAWPADAIRLDAFDSASGAGPFYAKCNFRETARATYKNAPLIYYEFLLS
ncbi:MAG: GNAT family N-acetyltransferase [Terracidiphilus sp.]|jgi:GNAT superfamily N-acetyltransferase